MNQDGLQTKRWRDELMTVISSANVACGFHAGDPVTMRSAVASAKRHGVAIGAHPGLPDLLGFGRRRMTVAPSDVADYVLYQVGAVAAFAHAAGVPLHHVKPHGALYMMALEDGRVARAIVEAVGEFDDRLPIYTLAGGELWHAAKAAGLGARSRVLRRPADPPRRLGGDVRLDLFDRTPEAVAARVRSLLTTGAVTSLEGDPVTGHAVSSELGPRRPVG
jgi:UPF0271 protein